MLTGGNRSESIVAMGSNFIACIRDADAIALVCPVEGKPSMRYPPSTLASVMLFIRYRGFVNQIRACNNNSIIMCYADVHVC